MVRLAGFHKDCAKVLAENLHHLKDNSIKLLEDDRRPSADEMLFSFVTVFDYTKELKKFRLYVSTAGGDIPFEKKVLFASGILAAQNNN